MSMLVPGLTPIEPAVSDQDPLHRIGFELQSILADTLTAPLTGDMLLILHRLEGVELERYEVRASRHSEPPRPCA